MRSRFIFAALAAVLALSACSDDSVSSGGNGRLTVKLTDAPGDLKAAFVKINSIVLIRSDADSTSTDSTKRITLTPLNTGFINLLNLSGGQLLTLVNLASVPKGTYSQVRVVVTDAYVQLNDGRYFATSTAALPVGTTASGTLKCPSCAHSGYKVKFAGNGLNIVGNSTVVLDFDAAQSFGHEAGKSGQWIMHPVLRATATTIRFARISGNVTLKDSTVTIPACGGQNNTLAVFRPLAIAAPDTISGSADSTGAYAIANLLPGTYTVGYANELTFTNGDSLTIAATPSVSTLTLAEAENATANYQITAATCH